MASCFSLFCFQWLCTCAKLQIGKIININAALLNEEHYFFTKIAQNFGGKNCIFWACPKVKRVLIKLQHSKILQQKQNSLFSQLPFKNIDNELTREISHPQAISLRLTLPAGQRFSYSKREPGAWLLQTLVVESCTVLWCQPWSSTRTENNFFEYLGFLWYPYSWIFQLLYLFIPTKYFS